MKIILSNEDLLSINEAAVFWRVHPNTIRRHIKSGRLPSVRLGGTGAYRIRRADLENIAAGRAALKAV